MNTAIDRIRQVVGPAGWIDDPAGMTPYLTETRGLHHGRARAVVCPPDTPAVAAVMAECHAAGIAVVPQGGNTGRCAGAAPDASGEQLVLCLRRMRRIREVDAENYSISVDAGCVLAEVQAAAAARERLFPLSLGAEGSCQIGGNLATNAGGSNVLRYGNARELTLGLEVVLADGRVWDGMNRLRKNNTGYDLRDLFIGSEGTLGVITGAVLRLYPRADDRHTALLGLASLNAAVALLGRLRAACGEALTACEVMSRTALGFAVRHVADCRDPLGTSHPWYLLVVVGGAAGSGLGEALEACLADALTSGLLADAAIARSEAQARAFWRLREGAVEAQAAEGASVKHDVSVPLSALVEFITRADAAVTALLPGTRPCAFGHLGDGNIHYNLSQPPGMAAADFLARWGDFNRAVDDIAIELGGSFSAEHGIGRLKVGEMARYKSEVELALMRSIKQALDPRGILNPGKLLPEAAGS